MKVMILAAGMGNRIEALTDESPKALLQVRGRPLIDYTLSFADHLSVTKIGVVGGYGFPLLKKHLEGKNVELFENTNYRDGNLFSLMAGADFLDDDFLLMNVDHIYPQRLLDHILKRASGLTACCDFDRPLVADDMKVRLTRRGKLDKIAKDLRDYDGGYIGMTYCARERLPLYREAVGETVKTLGKKAYVEAVLGCLAASNAEINICNTSGFRWHEIDTPADFQKAEAALGSVTLAKGLGPL